MQTQINQIINLNVTKTEKIRRLIMLGMSRTEIAGLLTGGNYGFVQNVYSKMRAEGLIEQLTQNLAPFYFTPREFDREFGVEFEAYNVEKSILKQKLQAAGINCEIEDYNHSTRRHWKIVHDSSLSGSNTFELVSPILKGEAGISEVLKVCRGKKKA